MSRPSPAGGGRWFLSVSVQYLHLSADNLAAINGGKREAVIARVGVGFVF